MRDRPFLLLAAVDEHALDHFQNLHDVIRGHLLRGAAEMKPELVEDLRQLCLQICAEQFVVFAQHLKMRLE